MRKTFTIASLVLTAAAASIMNAQQAPSVLWQKAIGGNSSENVNVIGVSPDATKFVTVGVSYSTDHHAVGNRGSGDALMTIGDVATGDLVSYNLGGSDLDDILGISNTSDGGYILAGLTNSQDYGLSTKGGSDVWLVKMNAEGQVQWQKTYGGYFMEWTYKAVESEDGGFIFTGHTESWDGDVSGTLGGASDIWMGKVDAAGDLVWEKRFRGTDVETSYDMVAAPGGGAYIVGGTYSTEIEGSKGMYDGLIIKINDQGTVEWSRAYGGTDDDVLRRIVLDTEGNLIVGGTIWSYDHDITGNKGMIDYWVMKVSPSGEVIWSKTYGGTQNDQFRSIDVTNEGGIIAAGYTFSNNGDVSGNHGSNDMWLIALDGEGNKIWQKALGGANGDLALNIRQLPDGSFLAGGVVSSFDGDVPPNLGDTDGCLLHLGAALAVEDTQGKSSVSVYPNPFSEELYLKSDQKINSTKLTDMSGRVVPTESIESKNGKINASKLQKGMYILTVETEKGTETRKVIKK